MMDVQQLKFLRETNWLDFMDCIYDEFSFLSHRGKPTKKIIDDAFDGSDFTSMSEFVSAENGLNWNMSGWNSWKRAYKNIKEVSYLRDTNLTSSQINTIAKELKKSKKDFPESLENFQIFLKERQKNLKLDHNFNLSKAETQIEKLKNTTESQKKKVEDLEEYKEKTTKLNLDFKEKALKNIKNLTEDLKKSRDIQNLDIEYLMKNAEVEKLFKENKNLKVTNINLEKDRSYWEKKYHKALPWPLRLFSTIINSPVQFAKWIWKDPIEALVTFLYFAFLAAIVGVFWWFKS
jgi:hypothetical protein